ncbi:hypothetical protein E2C01_046093 [Portunus trituberculatus]|uniref:Uncharacterized protein n=1 Tax=Portunus trituberculatus TaxID=210409 RepID=A0A5B7FWW6_PORTR|nr:hypothetical protein [Portunus trituberculatus]
MCSSHQLKIDGTVHKEAGARPSLYSFRRALSLHRSGRLEQTTNHKGERVSRHDGRTDGRIGQAGTRKHDEWTVHLEDTAQR